jgi:hypothetical protein
LDFRVDPVPEVASVPFTCGKKTACLFGRLGLDAPFLDASHDYIGMK